MKKFTAYGLKFACAIVAFALAFSLTGIGRLSASAEDDRQVLIEDDCTTLEKVDSTLSTMDHLKVDGGSTISRNMADVVFISDYDAIGPGSARDDHVKNDVPRVVYHTSADIKDFEIKVELLFNYADVKDTTSNKVKEAVLARFNLFVSNDGEEWHQLYGVKNEAEDPQSPDVDFTAEAGSIEPNAYSILTVKNVKALPISDARYLRVDLLGEVSVEETLAEGGHANDAGYKYGSTYLNYIPESEYNTIKKFTAVYSPWLRGVKIYAAADAQVEEVATQLGVNEVSGKTVEVRKGTDTKITLWEILSTAQDNKTPVADYSAVNVTVTEGEGDLLVTKGDDGITLAIDENYAGTAGMVGTATVHITKDNAVLDLTVNLVIPVESIAITPADASVAVNTRLQLEAKILPENASNNMVIWSVDKTESARVDGSGRFTATAAGTYTVTATADEKSTTVTITVYEVTVAADSSVPTSVKVGDTVTLKAVVTPEDAGEIVWEITSGDAFATLENGVLTAKSAGIVKVSGTVAGSSVEYTITITAATEGSGSSCGSCSSSMGSGALGALIMAAGALALKLRKRG